ncbi:protein phosphatase 1 regulatory subunit 3C-like [Argiope bruennichi]|uniref:Protein phosphatase 1 regulatory subunit 3C like protein n=1 Tax=Argiope bruennichi TaxID=94029 RepID=A0A8T0FGM5_ARGBR|nr:protein phosphatase 1 regulatory subunit 3C-like [Argiope bruennichi]KAF8790131.1 Protein phosphatase 1 regulatory subunit 3C like protein [Argiope bruennichi]
MPIDLDMLLHATGSPLFSCTPFGNERYSLASAYGDSDYNAKWRPRRFGIIHDRPVFPSYKLEADLKSENKENSAPGETPPLPDGIRKKKVSFADDKGLELVEVREIPGTQKWNDEVLTWLVDGSQKLSGNQKSWKVAFDHPPRKDSEFLELVEANNIVLESINVENTCNSVLNGTIKVKNLSYEKNVFVRITFDRWMSHVDVKAGYVKPTTKVSAKADLGKYDNFSFSAKIEPSAIKYGVIEFCVCLECDGNQYWDNNGGINYRLVADSTKENAGKVNDSEKFSDEKITLSLTDNIENFSEIDAWSNLMYNQPYW